MTDSTLKGRLQDLAVPGTPVRTSVTEVNIVRILEMVTETAAIYHYPDPGTTCKSGSTKAS